MTKERIQEHKVTIQDEIYIAYDALLIYLVKGMSEMGILLQIL